MKLICTLIDKSSYECDSLVHIPFEWSSLEDFLSFYNEKSYVYKKEMEAYEKAELKYNEFRKRVLNKDSVLIELENERKQIIINTRYLDLESLKKSNGVYIKMEERLFELIGAAPVEPNDYLEMGEHYIPLLGSKYYKKAEFYTLEEWFEKYKEQLAH